MGQISLFTPYILYVPLPQRKDMYPMLIFYYKKTCLELSKTLFTLIFGLMGTEIFVSKVGHFCQYAENSRFSKSNLTTVSHQS
jgi:hypothetical protein